MTLLQLSYFVALADTLHYTKTAELLHVSQPSLSYAIGEAEKDLGVKLFQKDRQGVTLTKYGLAFYPYAKRALEALDNGRNLVTVMAEKKESVVRWGYFHSVSASLVPALIRELKNAPESKSIRLELIEDSTSRLFSMLKDGELDFCFSCHSESWAESVPVTRQYLYLAVPAGHRLSDRSSVSFEDFAHERLIMLTRGSDLRVQIDQLFSDNGVAPDIAFETRECNAALQYVALDLGIAILPYVPAMDRDNIVSVPILTGSAGGEEKLGRTIFLSYHKTRPMHPSVRFVVDNILAQMNSSE